MLIPITEDALLEEIKNIGAHQVGVDIMTEKRKILPFKALQLRTPGVNILKQEMLSLGGECVVPLEAVTCAKDKLDVILLATPRQYELLCKKLEQMQYFGLGELLRELQLALNNKKPQTTLKDGRVLEYKDMAVMGILNITPDSFYANSRVPAVEEAVDKAEKMLKNGATILDIGGESSRPGAKALGVDEEIQRVVPIIKAIKEKHPEAIISIDTYHSETAKAALGAGADILNDISAGTADDNMLEIAAQYKAPIILMHMRGTPKNMQENTHYDNVVDEVTTYLLERAKLCEEKGLGKDKVILDPGIGFAKETRDNLKLMQNLKALTMHGYPVLLAASRKTVIGKTLGDIPPEERLEGTIATSLQAVECNAQMVRVHDVLENVRAIRMLEAIKKCQ